jgi:hypothetical protein
MSPYEDFQRNADEAVQMAHSARSDKEKTAWLRIAEGWLRLIPDAIKAPRQAFEAEVRAKGTGQQDSTSSH